MRPVSKMEHAGVRSGHHPGGRPQGIRGGRDREADPTHLELPGDVMAAAVGDDARPLTRREPVRPEPSARELLRAAGLLRAGWRGRGDTAVPRSPGHRSDWAGQGPIDTLPQDQAVATAVDRLLRLRRGEQVELQSGSDLDPAWREMKELSPASYWFTVLKDGPAGGGCGSPTGRRPADRARGACPACQRRHGPNERSATRVTHA